MRRPSINDDPADGTEDDVESFYYALHNANYNVQLVVDDAGVVVERYEYTPYGERQVYFSPGTNDPEAHAPTSMSRRVVLSSIEQPYGLCEFGHQGLMHDESVGLIYNRARHLHPTWGRFMQVDPLEYVVGFNYYEYNHSNPIKYVDETGRRPRLPMPGPSGGSPDRPREPIVNLRDHSQIILNSLTEINPNDLRLQFLRIQQCILNKLANGSCCRSEESQEWLADVLRNFMGSLNNALQGSFANYEREGDLQARLRGELGSPLWRVVFRRINSRNFGGYSNLRHLPGGASNAATILMAQVHINDDLRVALLQHGPGSDEDWDCIGDVVAECGSMITGMPMWLQSLGANTVNQEEGAPNINVQDWRDVMRDRVIDELGLQ